jgi:hypothetical protein
MHKTTRSFGLPNDAEERSVLLEPLPGHTESEVVAFLKRLGASKVEVLSPGFISARAAGVVLQKLHSVAHIHVKHEKRPLLGR